jgi:3-hydroxybutyryl-CoA dehydratase
MNVGDSASLSRVFHEGDLAEYARFCGHEPANDMVPEPLIGALFSTLLGMHLPGPGTAYLKQETRWLRECFVGQTLTARVAITRIRADKALVDLETTCHDADGHLVATGRALVSVSDVTPSA